MNLLYKKSNFIYFIHRLRLFKKIVRQSERERIANDI